MSSQVAFLTDLSPIWLEDGQRCITRQINCVQDVKRIVKTMAQVLRSKEDLFTVYQLGGRTRVRATRLGQAFFHCARVDLREIARHYPRHRFSPLYTIFKRYGRGLAEGSEQLAPHMVEGLNAAVEKIRAFGRGRALRRRLENLSRCERANRRAASKLLSEVRDQYSKLLAIRIDLGYFSEYGPSGFGAQTVTLREAQAHRDLFLSYLRRGPFAHRLVGYIWKLESAFEKGFHYHVAVFLDGQQVHKDITIGDMLGEHWKAVTEGKGVYFNCNKNKEAYRECGIGMLNRSDDLAWGYLGNAVHYLTKVDLYLRFQAPARVRTFGLGGPYRTLRRTVSPSSSGPAS